MEKKIKILKDVKRKMKEKIIRRNKVIFIFMIFISFGAIFVYNFLTPVMSDDLLFDKSAYQTIADIFIKEYERYLTWNGRSVLQILMTVSCLIPKWLFNIINSLVFVGFSLLIYCNIGLRKKYDFMLYALIQLCLWNFSVDFSQTVLWLSGACNYLWGITIILGFVTAYRYFMEKGVQQKHKGLVAVIMFPLGLLAGWGNENTSGGAGLILLIFTVLYFYKNKRLETWMFTGMGGMAVGFALLLMAPGNAVRGAIVKAEESYSGLAAYVSRGLKVFQAINEHFMIYLVVIILLGTYFYYTKRKKEEFIEPGIFGLAAFATAAVLIFTPEPMARAYFGANIYIMIAALQMVSVLRESDLFWHSLRTGIILAASVWMCFSYVEEGANLARILREVNERENYIIEQKAQGNEDLILPKLRPQFETKYSFMYQSDISEEEGFWINEVYRMAYGLESVTAMEREEWEAMR